MFEIYQYGVGLFTSSILSRDSIFNCSFTQEATKMFQSTLEKQDSQNEVSTKNVGGKLTAEDEADKI